MRYSPEEKQEIFIKRTKEKFPWVWAEYCELIAHELMSRDELHDYNFRKRIEMLRFAYENTVFYRNLYDAAGVSPDDIRTEEDWDRIPVVTKQMVREHFKEMLVAAESDTFKKYARPFHTGGSTGRPLQVIRDGRELPAQTWRSRGWWIGRQIGSVESVVPVLGQDEAIISRFRGFPIAEDLKLRAEHLKSIYPMMRFYLDAQNMTGSSVSQFLTEVHSHFSGGGGFLCMATRGLWLSWHVIAKK